MRNIDTRQGRQIGGIKTQLKALFRRKKKTSEQIDRLNRDLWMLTAVVGIMAISLFLVILAVAG